MNEKIFSKTNLLFLLILTISVILRFLFIDKSDGLWYDELVMYNQASQPDFKSVVLTALTEDVHLPLYQLLLHFHAKIFGFSDFSLRSFSAMAGVLAVILSFFTGKSLKSNENGLVLMSLFAVNSFLIYYSQEVRMYELLALFAILNIFSIIKFNSGKIWQALWIISSTALILTYTISIIYVFIQVAAYFIFTGKNINKNFAKCSLILCLVNLPVIFYLIYFRNNFIHFITGFYSDWSSLFVVLQNFFTPVLVGLENNPVHYVKDFILSFNLQSLIFVAIPMCIAVYLIFYSLKLSKIARFLFVVSTVFLLVEVFAFVFTDFKILSRYLILILPNFLVLLSVSAVSNKRNFVLFLVLLLLNFSYLAFSQKAAFRAERNGFLPLVRLLEQNGIKDNDIVVVWNRKEVLSKYLNKKVIVLSILKDFAYKSEFVLKNNDEIFKTNEAGKKKILREYFKSDFVPENTALMAYYIISGMPKGQKLFITSYEYFDTFNHKSFVKIVENDEDYEKMTYNNLITIKSLLDLKLICDKNLIYKGMKIQSPFFTYIYEK